MEVDRRSDPSPTFSETIIASGNDKVGFEVKSWLTLFLDSLVPSWELRKEIMILNNGWLPRSSKDWTNSHLMVVVGFSGIQIHTCWSCNDQGNTYTPTTGSVNGSRDVLYTGKWLQGATVCLCKVSHGCCQRSLGKHRNWESRTQRAPLMLHFSNFPAPISSFCLVATTYTYCVASSFSQFASLFNLVPDFSFNELTCVLEW